MDKLFETIGTSEIKDLLANGEATPVAVSMEPGNGIVPYGTVIYRKSGVLYAPAAAANVKETAELLVLRDNVDTSGSATVAVAAAAYEKGTFKAGAVKIADGNGGFSPVTAAQAIILRKQGITFSPFDDWREDDVEADNTASSGNGD